jgi:hypothetical protein
VLGIVQGGRLRNGDQTKYAPDMSCFIVSYVYFDSRVADQIIFGNTITNLLQLIAVEGYNGDVIQRESLLPLMHNILAKEIDVYNSLPRWPLCYFLLCFRHFDTCF